MTSICLLGLVQTTDLVQICGDLLWIKKLTKDKSNSPLKAPQSTHLSGYSVLIFACALFLMLVLVHSPSLGKDRIGLNINQ